MAGTRGEAGSGTAGEEDEGVERSVGIAGRHKAMGRRREERARSARRPFPGAEEGESSQGTHESAGTSWDILLS